MTIRCRVALQTGNYPHTAGFFADQIAAFPSTRPRANVTAPLGVCRIGARGQEKESGGAAVTEWPVEQAQSGIGMAADMG